MMFYSKQTSRDICVSYPSEDIKDLKNRSIILELLFEERARTQKRVLLAYLPTTVSKISSSRFPVSNEHNDKINASPDAI